ncbi:hypothetical protein OH687_19675 [Burkholderia anthina]|nr:hypothetical protein OH687_19675 [Burkholderia anthina]
MHLHHSRTVMKTILLSPVMRPLIRSACRYLVPGVKLK